MSKLFSLCVRVPVLPNHGKTHLELYAANFSANLWTEKACYAFGFTRTSAKEIANHSQRVRRLDVRIKEFPPVPESDSINGSSL